MLTQCTCQTSAMTLSFSLRLVTHLSTADICELDSLLCAECSHHIYSDSPVLLPPRLIEAELQCYPLAVCLCIAA